MPNNSNIELRSEEVQEILSSVPNWMIRWGNSLVLLIILILLAITWFVKYPDIINAQAMVTTQIPPHRVYANTTGNIDTLFVTDNLKVTSNSPLAIIENTANYKDVFYLKSIVDTLVFTNKKFFFPIDSMPILFLGDIDTDYALFENSYLQYQLNKQLQPFSNDIFNNKITISELKTRLKSLQSQKKISKAELDFQENNLNRYKILYEKGVISLQEYETKQTTFLQAQRSYSNIDTSISQLREAISNANNTSSGTIITQTKEEISLLKNVIQSFNQLKRAIRTWESRYVLSSKINGKVSFLNIWNKNQTVNQGDLVFTIIPKNNSEFIAKLKTPAQNSGKIKIGQTVNIKLENYPDTEYGSLQGKIKSISQIPNPEGFYLVNVSLPTKLITSYDKEIPFKQEMKGAAEIITEDLRLMERFFYQLRNVFK
ncbi:MAG: HlyD family secretion protein [Flavobacterium sp.]|nr:MAG: HlyD family secretion protein [Flavobacterium sp.]